MRYHVVLAALAAAALFTSTTQAGTAGQWLMEDLYDQTPGPPNVTGGFTTSDSSGNARDFVASTDFGSVALSTNVPSVMAPGSKSLLLDLGGARGFSTPVTNALGVGNTGQLTVEFWFKSTQAPSTFGYLFSWGVNDGTPGDWYFYGTSSSVRASFTPNTGFPELNFGSANDGNWHHLAATVVSGGQFKIYTDGVLQGAANVGAFPNVARGLKLGRNSGDSFAYPGWMIDDLRISDVALLPGNGTGVGELAWHAQLPEPSVALTGVAILGVLARRRRGV